MNYDRYSICDASEVRIRVSNRRESHNLTFYVLDKVKFISENFVSADTPSYELKCKAFLKRGWGQADFNKA